MAEVTIYAEQVGGSLGKSESTWSALMAATTSYASDYIDDESNQVSVSLTYLGTEQSLWRFNIGANLPPGATIDYAKLGVTTNAWSPAGWSGCAAGEVEAYAAEWYTGAYHDTDFFSHDEIVALYAAGKRAATSPLDPGQGEAADVRDWEFVSDEGFPGLINPAGYLDLVLVAFNWRTGAEENRGWNGIRSPYHTTEASRPRILLGYTEAAGGGGTQFRRAPGVLRLGSRGVRE